MSTDQQTEKTAAPAVIVATAGAYYRNARYIMFAIILAMGCWFLYDGFVKYPAENVEYKRLSDQLEQMDRKPRTRDEAEYLRLTTMRKNMTKHEEFSIGLQKLLGFSLPPIGAGLLAYWLRKSRGQIRLENRILTIPGEPAVSLDDMDELDKALWEKKGIAYVYYTLPNNTTGKLRLDDFIFQARPIRDIVKRIEDELAAQDELIAQAKKAQKQ